MDMNVFLTDRKESVKILSEEKLVQGKNSLLPLLYL